MLGFAPIGALPVGSTQGDAPIAYSLADATGEFSVTEGQDTGSTGRHTPGQTGEFHVTGDQAKLSTEGVSGHAGEFSVTGETGGVQAQHQLPGATGEVAVRGARATLEGIARPTTPVALMLAAAAAGNAPVIGYYTVPQKDIFDLGYEGVIAIGITASATGAPLPT